MTIEPIRFSWLKHFARSPMHAKAELDNPRPLTAAMDLGAIAHRIVLGPREGDGELAIWTGDVRRGKAWDAFVEEHKDDVIVRSKDFNAAKRIAAAVQADETAAELLEGARFEVPLKWNEYGFKCETRGIDILKPHVLVELKSTTNTEPEKFKRQCFQMLYAQQIEFYRGALEATGHPVERCSIIGVETTPPYAVTVLDLTPALLQFARKSIVTWFERLRVCLADDHWPAYRQRSEVFDLPAYLAELPDEEQDEAPDAA